MRSRPRLRQTASQRETDEKGGIVIEKMVQQQTESSELRIRDERERKEEMFGRNIITYV